MNLLDSLPISRKRKVTMSRDMYREFNENASKLQGLGYELTHQVTHNKNEDTFTVELLGDHNLEQLDKMLLTE